MFLLRDLVSPRTWLAMISHLAGLFLGLAVMVVFITGLSLGFSLLVLALIGLPILGLTLRAATLCAAAERARLGLMLGVQIPAWPDEARAGYRWAIVPRWRMLTERATWSELGYGLLRLPFSAIAVTLCFSAWAAGLVALTLPLYNESLPSGGAKIGDFVLGGTPRMTASAVIGLLVLLAAPQLTRGLAVADAALSRRLLGPRRDLAARVTELEISRERVVDAAEAERRGWSVTCTTARNSGWSRWPWSSAGPRRSSPTTPTPPGSWSTRRMPRPRRPSPSCATSSAACTRRC